MEPCATLNSPYFTLGLGNKKKNNKNNHHNIIYINNNVTKIKLIIGF